jgi:hypothetical protein
MPDLLTLLFGWMLGIVTVGAAFSIRRALLTPQEREERFQRRSERLGLHR